MNNGGKAKNYLITKEMAKQWEKYLGAREQLKRDLGRLVGRVEEEPCPSICEIASGISDAMFLLHDIVVWLTDEAVAHSGDFTVNLSADIDQSTELVPVKGGRCSGFALNWGDFDGKKFSECMAKIREWLLTIGEAAC
jgi:hypothetical protein